MAPTLAEIRTRFRTSPQCKIVSADVYISRLTGRDQLVRADEPSANLLGLLDESTGTRILVPAEEFMRHHQCGSPATC
ncbi:hypothetical protein [Planctomicrobium sp. SH664]|uniref:hypothetical protein n=1 Tax=Planctomicrobium sp. SH664 TaxID=3448125 RepID=UPI003F5BBD71